ncbi:hypothetical protein B0H66DRAFT_469873 [Apodospora peruviana]|uniref:Aminomethyltransferase n=1 Tax=Apodospora peruviana TaxID=516989 RepID=A0AAE0IS87_9PEZI|nr:hypothetical protein B0H66DRAFT_469873 [Apodospora peruviana]
MQRIKPSLAAGALRGTWRSSSNSAARFTTLRTTRTSRPPASQHNQFRRSPVSPLTQKRNASSSSSSSETLAKTPLYELHLANGGKMVPFGGFHMPVQYKDLSVSQSHAFTRERGSIFDVSHMVQRIFTGAGAAHFLQRVTPSDLERLPIHQSTLSCLLKSDGSGGIVDDTIITRLPDQAGDGGNRFYVVTNAGCRDKDNEYFDRELAKWSDRGEKVVQEQLDGWGLVALQGPDAEGVLAEALADHGKVDLKKLYFGQSIYAQVKMHGMRVSSPLLISRGGYTGEDGFEISIPGDETVEVTEAFLATGGPDRVRLAGLGARDSLRLEAGMCLYGHDLNEEITPVQAGLSWIIPKERRTPEAEFYGAGVIVPQLIPKSKGGAGVSERRVGLVVEGAPAREGAEIVSRPEGKKLGVVTSGCPSPTLGKNIAMGYIQDGSHKAGTEVDVVVRGRPRKAVVTKMPFVPTKYWKGTAPA